MDAWILDESPGSYRWGTIDAPALRRDDVQIRVVTSALNHMDLWVTRGCPNHRCRTCRVATSPAWSRRSATDVTGVAVGDEVVVNPGVSPVADIVALGNDSPMGPGFEIYGEHTWGGHATYAVAPERNVFRRPVGRSWEECAAYPLATLTAYRMLKRARIAPGHTVWWSASARACRALRWRSLGTSAPRSSPRAAAKPSAARRCRWERRP